MPSKMDWKNGARLSEVIPALAQIALGGCRGVEKAGLREIFYYRMPQRQGWAP